MKLVEGHAAIGTEIELPGATTYRDVDAFIDALSSIGARTDCAIQPFDARLIVDASHLRSAVEHANRAWVRNEAVADDRAVEILCYAAGRRQIQQAMEFGVCSGEQPVVVVVDDGTCGVPAEDCTPASGDEATAAAAVTDILDTDTPLPDIDREAIQSLFEISATELTAADGDLSLVVQERVALLDVEK